MSINAETLRILVARELERLSDARVLRHIRSLLIEPELILRDWDYGRPGEKYPSWTVLKHHDSNTGIAYCESGFGPRRPWGLVFIGDDEGRGGIGMDSDWFTSFLDAYFDSLAATDLPIWSVFRQNPSWPGERLTEEATWDATWAAVEKYRSDDAESRFDCHHSIGYQHDCKA